MEMEFCKDCFYRDNNRHCNNLEKIRETGAKPQSNADDSLIYDYNEGGGFEVGDFFGCVHFTTRKD